jgi:hypothetical protein
MVICRGDYTLVSYFACLNSFAIGVAVSNILALQWLRKQTAMHLLSDTTMLVEFK